MLCFKPCVNLELIRDRRRISMKPIKYSYLTGPFISRVILLLFMVLFAAISPSYASYAELTAGAYGANSSVMIGNGLVSSVTGCPSGGINDFIYPYANVYVVPKGVPTGALSDVSNADGVPNALTYVLVDEVIANTGPGGYLISGDYAVVINECQDGKFNPSIDTYGPEFSVRIPANINPLDSAAFAAQLGAVKGRAYNMSIGYFQTAALYVALFGQYNAITLYSIATDPLDFLLFACTNVNFNNPVGGQCSLTDAWTGLLDLEKSVTDYIVNQAFYYKGISADPPDPNFKMLPILDKGFKADVSLKPAYIQSALKFGELASQERALTQALLQAMERYQGAQQAGFGEYAYVQAREIEKHSRALAGLVLRSSAAFQGVANDASASGINFVATMNDYRAAQARVKSSGLTAAERTRLIAAGWTDAQIAAGVADYLARDFSGMQNNNELTLLAGKISTEAAAMSTELTALADVMVTTQANLASQLRLPFPKANAGGPYVVNAGVPLLFSGSATLADPVTPKYEWDFNLDGVFDDATGQTPTFTFNRAYDGYVGLKVTLPNGYYDISYARLTVNNVNSSPVITSLLPVGPATIPYNGSQVFTVAATDPDSDPITYSWTIDGAVVGTGTTYTYVATMAAVGEHIVTVTVSDNSNLSAPTRNMWRLTVTGIDADGDGIPSSVDCNDNDPTIGVATVRFYRDADGDGWGDPNISLVACTQPVGYVTNNLDCNDNDPSIGKMSQTFYRDADGDGLGNPNISIMACAAPPGYVANTLDCNDSDPLITTSAIYFQDADGDGFGDITKPLLACLQPPGYVTNSLDCNDANPYINPSRKEIVHNGQDDDCNVATPDNWSKSFVVAADDSGYIYYAKSNGDGTFSNYKQIQYIGGTSRGILIEDFNGDGFLDFIVARSDGAYLQFNNDGSDNFTFKDVVAQFPANGCWGGGMSAGDFNNDGLIDFAANNGCSNMTAVFLNNGKGGFASSTYTLPTTGRSLNVADIDGDGNIDFVVAMYGSNDILLFKGDGNGGFTQSTIGTAPGSASDNYALAAADFDNDGKVDIILGGSSNGNPYFFKGNGNGTFQAPVDVPSLDTNYYNAIDAYDLNNDGNVDVVLADYSGVSLWFYPGLGNGTFGPRVKINTTNTIGAVLSIAAPPIGNPIGFPYANAEPKLQTIAVGGSASFDGSFSRYPAGSIISYDWKFGDGSLGSGAKPTHKFLTEGFFKPSLIVSTNDGKKAVDSAQVKVVGNAPVANAGGPYTFGEQYASGGVYTVPLNGTGSTDDFGIATYAWYFSVLNDAFTGTTIDSSKWLVSTGVTQNGKVSIPGASSWDNRYLFSQDNFAREDGLTFEFRVKPGTVDYQHAMFGVKNSSTNYSYTQMPHAFYFYQGNMTIYEDGANRGNVATYTRGVQYDLKLELKTTGALYYMRETGKPDWLLIYSSAYSTLPTLKIGGTVYADTFEFDDVTAHVTVYGQTPNKLLPKGTFPVTLTVTDKAGQQASDSTTVSTVTGISPTANPGGPYLVDETKASQNAWTVTLDGSASTDDTGIEIYSWNFGDGTSGTEVKPAHSYTGAGIYTVTLTVTDRSGQTNTATTTVTTKGNAFPVANPGGPYNVNEELVVNKHWSISVDGAASTDDVGIWKYEWNFGDGTAVAAKTATHEYAAPGTYTVTLKVTDNANQSHTATTTAAVVGTTAPTASPGGPYVTEPNTPVNFDGSGSTDNTGILSYSWNFGDGTTGKGAKPVHAYSAVGTYPVTLTVTDTALQTKAASTTVVVAVGNPPVANAGGPYTSNIGVPVRLNGSGSTDDFGVASFAWQIGDPGSVTTLLQDGFPGTILNSGKWLFSVGVDQNEAVTLAGGYGWGSRYLFSASDFTVDGSTVITGQVTQVAGGHLMFGFKNTNNNFSYDQMPYALYFSNGVLQVYEDGAYRGQFGTYSNNILYDVKVELKPSVSGGIGGARYFYKEASSSTWNLLYDSSYAPASSTFKAGASNYSGTFVIDNVLLTIGNQTASGEKPVVIPRAAGTYPVQLTVTDGAGQTSTASTTLTVSSDPLVYTAPWQFTGGVEVPHDTWSGEEVILKAVVKSGKAPITYSWDFGDGNVTAPAPVTNTYDLSARHTYTAADGTPITARITVTDADGKSSSDLFPIIVRPKSLNIEVNKSIDDALWYVHTTQNKSNGSWESSGYTGGYFASSTASAIHSMEINGHLEVGDFSNDPYVEDVWKGMQFVLTTLNAPAISEQSYGDPDVNGNGYGIQVNSGRPIYEGGPVMMALVASGTPNMKAVTGGAGIIGRTYRDIVEDMAEMYFWGQNDDPVSGGAWQYSWNSGNDNSASQWAVLGLEAAEEQNWVKIPQWVRDRNVIWLTASRSGDGNGYGYTGSGNDVATTPSGLAQVAFNKIPTTDSRWKQPENFLASYWDYWYNGSGNYYALYSMAKSLRTAKPKEVTILGEGTAYAIDWYNDPTRGVARTIVNQQDANGMFTGGGGTHWAEGSFRTAWGVIILTKTLFVLPPVAVAGDSKVWGVDWPLTFDGSKSYHLDPFRKIVKYEWDFNGDGVYDSSSDQPTVTHTYSSADYPVSSLPKTFKVSLRVTDNNDPPKYDTSTVNIIIAVPPHPPVAVPGGPYTGNVGVPVQLDGSASYDIDPTDFISAYGWELDGIYPYNFTDASGAKPTYTFSAPGTYNIGLQVTDNGVLSPGNAKLTDIKWTTVIIKSNSPPAANAGGPYSVTEGGTIQLDGSASSDPDGNTLTYTWDLDNDGTFETAGVKPSFSRPDNGIFTVRLKVSDGALEAIATTTVTVQNVAPIVTPLSPATINEGSTYLAAGSFTDPGADTWTATVNYGDGSGIQPLTLAGKSFSLSHLYPQNGSYTVTVTVTDKDAGSGSATALLTVNNVAPVVNAGPDATLLDTGAFASSGSFTDPGADTWTATVNYGDGTGTQALALNANKTFALSHLYAANGKFTVTVTVSDNDGGSGSASAAVTVNNSAPVVNAGPNSTITEGGTLTSSGSFTDAGSVSWTATVNYGDGSAPQALALNANKTFGLSHVYAQNGIYTATVTVTDNDGGVGAGTATVTVTNVAPAVNAGSNATITEGGTFTGSGSFTDPGTLDTWTATVNYGDGSATQALTLTNKAFSLNHIYAQNGSYTVTVSVTDNGGGVGTGTAIVTVANVAPVVNAGSNATITEGGTFTGSGSFTDPGTLDTWTATVNYGDGSATQALTLTNKAFNLSHVYAQNGSYTVTVTVTDNGGGVGTGTATVTVTNVAPAVNAGPNATINEGGTFTSSGSFTDPGTLDSWSATVNYGDGSATQALALTNKAFNLSHVYAQNGSYTVTVTVTDNDGGVGTGTAIVTVTNVAPVVNAGVDAAINAGGTFTSSGSFTDPGTLDTWTATVNYGDGSATQALALNANKTFALSHLYTVNGSYTVTVTVLDNGGGTGSDTAVVTVNQVVVQPVQTIFNLTARAKPGKADLVWTAVPGNVKYNVYRGTVAGGPYSKVASGIITTYSTYAELILTNGTTYYWRVTSVDANGVESLYSNEASARPVAR